MILELLTKTRERERDHNKGASGQITSIHLASLFNFFTKLNSKNILSKTKPTYIVSMSRQIVHVVRTE